LFAIDYRERILTKVEAIGDEISVTTTEWLNDLELSKNDLDLDL